MKTRRQSPAQLDLFDTSGTFNLSSEVLPAPAVLGEKEQTPALIVSAPSFAPTRLDLANEAAAGHSFGGIQYRKPGSILALQDERRARS